MEYNVICHFGTKGMKWGVRRYQNKDGSLTYAGKKRALKLQDRYTTFTEKEKYRKANGDYTYAGRKKALKMKEKYSALTGGKTLKKFINPNSQESSSNQSKPKHISEMSNEEISKRIERIRLENTLKSLTPKKVSTGQKFVEGVKQSAISILRDKGTKIAADMFDKKIRESLDLSGGDSKKKQSEKLQQEALDAKNRYNKETFTRLYDDMIKDKDRRK